MPLYVSVAMVREGNRIFNHVFMTVAPTEHEAITRARAEVMHQHPTKEVMGASIVSVQPDAIREAYAELSKENLS